MTSTDAAFAEALAGFAAAHPGFVLELSGPWSEEGEPSNWICGFKEMQGARSIHPGSAGPDAKAAFEEGIAFLTEYERRRDAGENVRSWHVVQEMVEARKVARGETQAD